MAIATLMLRKKLELKRKDHDGLLAQREALDAREAELTRDIEEVENAEQQAAVEEAVSELEAQRNTLEESVKQVEGELDAMEAEVRELEGAQKTEPKAQEIPAKEERSDERMNAQNNVNMTVRDRLADMVTRDEVKSYLGEVRAAMKEKRALTNVGLTVPEVLLGLLRENVEGYSKLYKHVNVRRLSGDGRMVIMGAAPEAVWTECCANLNELNLTFNDIEVGCYKVGGYFAVCNATLEDSDINLANELVIALGQAIGLALDKAILYGRNTDAATRMPQGIVARLLQESQPAGYPATARAWEDLHTSNVKTIANSVTGLALFTTILGNLSAAKAKYARGGMTHAMNRTTYAFLMGQAANINAAGAIVTGMGNTMPIIGGEIELLDFIPDYVIVSGFYDNYLLAERAGEKFATSEHVRFLQDQTVFKGTARYDGGPAIAEAFVAQAINGASVTGNAVTFDPDKANVVESIKLNTATATVAGTGTVQLYAYTAPGTGSVTWTSATTSKATVSSTGLVTGVTSGSSVITATCNGKTASCTVTVT